MIDLIGEKRSMLLGEITHIFGIIFSNIVGRAIITGFAQVSKMKNYPNYFLKAMIYHLKIIRELTSYFFG